jgi:NAD-dependent DNA ligase
MIDFTTTDITKIENKLLALAKQNTHLSSSLHSSLQTNTQQSTSTQPKNTTHQTQHKPPHTSIPHPSTSDSVTSFLHEINDFTSRLVYNIKLDYLNETKDETANNEFM